MNFDTKHETDSASGQSVARDFVLLPRRQRLLTMASVMLAMFLAALSQTSLAAAMPRIVADLGGFDRYTWAATAYLIASTVAIPITGRLSDIYGRKIFFILGLAIFIVGSIPAGMSQSMTQLIVARAIKGIGGGIIIAASFIAVADLSPPSKRGRLQGLIGVVYGMSSVIGPTLAGFITDSFSWHWIFLMNVPAGIPVLWLIARTFPRISPEIESRTLDYPGMLTLILAVVPILLALSWGGVQYDWSSPQVTGCLIFGLALAATFVVIESTSDSPIMPLEIYKNRTVAVAALVSFLTGFGLYVTIIFTPLFLQGVQGTSATRSGGFLAPMVLGIVFGSILAGLLLARSQKRYRTQAVVTTAAMALGMYLISTLNEDTGFTQGVIYIVITGLGLGGSLATLNLAVQNSVPFRFVGVATSALRFYRLISGTLGLAVLGTVLTTRFSSRLDDTITDRVRATLPEGQLDAIRNNPRALVDSPATETLRANFADMGPDGIQLAEALLGSLSSALTGALADVFTISAVVVAIAVGVSLLLRVETP